MKIEILGGGCARCAALKKQLLEVVEELDIRADVESVTDPERLAGLGVMSLPVLLVDGVERASGGKISREDLQKALQR